MRQTVYESCEDFTETRNDHKYIDQIHKPYFEKRKYTQETVAIAFKIFPQAYFGAWKQKLLIFSLKLSKIVQSIHVYALYCKCANTAASHVIVLIHLRR